MAQTSWCTNVIKLAYWGQGTKKKVGQHGVSNSANKLYYNMYTVERRYNKVIRSSQEVHYIRNLVILGSVEACGGYNRNLKLFRYITNFVFSRFDCIPKEVPKMGQA